MTKTKQLIRVGHSPDSDDAFMFHALANNKLDTGCYEFQHELVDIQTLNRRAFNGELELTAISIHAYPYLNDVYSLCNCGASMGDDYGPMLISASSSMGNWTSKKKVRTIAVPGKLTTAFLALQLWIAKEKIEDVQFTQVPFDRVQDVVASGEFDAGVLIHEGQLTYPQMGLSLIVDFGIWWKQTTGLPLPLGANAIRKDLPWQTQSDVVRLLKASIEYGLTHRKEALDYALQFGRGLKEKDADKFVGMYVNDWTLDFGDIGRAAVKELLQRAYTAGIVPKRVVPEFI